MARRILIISLICSLVFSVAMPVFATSTFDNSFEPYSVGDTSADGATIVSGSVVGTTNIINQNIAMNVLYNWTIEPNGDKMLKLVPNDISVNYSTLESALGLPSSVGVYLNGIYEGVYEQMTNFAYMYADIPLSQGQSYTLAWNYVATDYAPYNDSSVAFCVDTTDSNNLPLINNVQANVMLLGATNIGTDLAPAYAPYTTGSYGSTGWQTVKYTATKAGTYRICIATFNCGDMILSPNLFVDDPVGTTYIDSSPFVPISPDPYAPPPAGEVFAPLEAPTGLNWNGTVASWMPVDGATGYSVQLYESGVEQGTPYQTDSSTTSYDFGALPDGNYTFSVVALGDYEDTANSASATSADKLVATPPAISGITNGATYYVTQVATVSDTNLDTVKLNGNDVKSPVTLVGNTSMAYTIAATDTEENSTTCTVTMKPIADLTTSINGITPSNVKSSDLSAIGAVKANASAIDLTYATQSEKDAIQGIIDNCNTLIAIILLYDSPTKTTVQPIGDTTFDPNVQLEVVQITDADAIEALNKEGILLVSNGSKIVSLFDISLLLNGIKIQPNGQVKVTLTLTPEQLKNFSSFQIAYIDENGVMAIIPSEINGNKITFITDHFSNYSIIGVPKIDDVPNTGGDAPNIPYFVLSFLLLGISVVVSRKRYTAS